ncbi:MAG: pyridoxal 5'-phosphate synthase glutaminase subunit PdxT [Methanoregula sp.]|nr:pyridoxal 5'-phosphate synthase glutaminase subunit PdxT [Methanoregula sp.]
MGVNVGVLALQGNVSEHIAAFECALDRMRWGDTSSVFSVKKAGELMGCDALAIPGGESTTISRLIEKNHLYEPIRQFPGGMFATCAGMVLIATHVDDPRVHPLCLIDMTVERNAFGRQRESFEADLVIDGIDGGPFHAVFIRAPVGTEVGNGVNVLARIDRGIVAVEFGKHMALAFHPELGDDTRLHERFLKKIGT